MSEQITFNNHRGESLAGTLHLPGPRARGGIVLGHCFTCSRHTGILRRLAEDLGNDGFITLRFDFSGNGQSEGVFSDSTYSKQMAEMEIAAKIVAEQGAEWIGAAGHSMGGLVAFLSTAQGERFGAVCALASRLGGSQAIHFLGPEQRRTLQQTGEVSFTSRGRSLKIAENFFSDAHRFNPTKMLKTFSKPLLIVHGDEDEVIPLEEAYKAETLSGGNAQLEVIPGADHMFSREQDRQAVSKIVVDWFHKLRSAAF